MHRIMFVCHRIKEPPKTSPPVAGKTRLAQGFFPETVELLVGFAQGIALVEAEDENRIAAILAVQVACARYAQQAVGFAQVEAHGEGDLPRFVRATGCAVLEDLVAKRFVDSRRAHHVDTLQTFFVEKAVRQSASDGSPMRCFFANFAGSGDDSSSSSNSSVSGSFTRRFLLFLPAGLLRSSAR